MAKEIVWVEIVGEHADLDVDRLAEEDFKRAVGSLLARFIAIEEEYDRVAQSAEHARVLAGECGSKCRNRIGESRTMAGDHIGVTLGDDRRLCFDDFPLRTMDSVERLRLVEDGRLGAVEVLRLLLRIEFAPTEGDRASEVVANWEDETIAEEINESAT